jgi:hypothetical protein
MGQRTKDEGPEKKDEGEREVLLDEVEQKALRLGQEVKAYTESTGDEKALAREIRTKLQTLLDIGRLAASAEKDEGREFANRSSKDESSLVQPPSETPDALEYVRSSLGKDEQTWGAVLAWLFTHHLGKLVTETDYAGQSRSWVDEWLLRKIIAGTLQSMGDDEAGAARGVLLVNALITQQDCLKAQAGEAKPAYRVVEAWLKDDDVRGFLQVNRHQNALWYNKEAFDQLLNLELLAAVLDAMSRQEDEPASVTSDFGDAFKIVSELQQAQAASEYRVEKLLAAARGDTPTPTASLGEQ